MKKLTVIIGIFLMCIANCMLFSQSVKPNNKPIWIKKFTFDNSSHTTANIQASEQFIYYMCSGPFSVGANIYKLDYNGNNVAESKNLYYDSSGTRHTYQLLLCNSDGTLDIYGATGRYYFSKELRIPTGFFGAKPTLLRFDANLHLRDSYTFEKESLYTNYSYTYDNRKNQILIQGITDDNTIHVGYMPTNLDAILEYRTFNFKPYRTLLVNNVETYTIEPSMATINYLTTRYDSAIYSFGNYLRVPNQNGQSFRVLMLPHYYAGSVKVINDRELYYSNNPSFFLDKFTTLYRINTEGIILSESKILPEINWLGRVQHITKDSGCIMTGSVYSTVSNNEIINDTSRNAIIVCLDKNGNVIWTDVYGLDGERDEFQKVTELADGTIVVSGYSGNSKIVARYKDIQFSETGITSDVYNSSMSISLNTDASVLTLHSATEVGMESVAIFDMIGNPVARGVMQQNTSMINVSHLSSGVYVAVLKNGNNQMRAKFLISR